jgi:hypothetical protein
MGYFRELPNLQVLNRTKNNVSSDEVVIIKNFFRKPKVREDFLSIFSAFEYYSITGNERPEQIAEKIYGDPELDWVILITNNITNIQEQWPLDLDSFNRYMLDKYGSEEAFSNIKHYETLSVKDSFNREVFPAGLIVDEAFYNAPEFESMDELPPGITFPPIYVPGTTATASAVVGAGQSISSIVITNSGAGYQQAPNVYISAPPVTANASASCVINNFGVSSIVSLVGGQGYNSSPNVSISTAPSSKQATASSGLGTGIFYDQVVSIHNLDGGVGYGLTSPTVTFSPPPNIIQGSYLNQSSGSAGNQIEGFYIRPDGVKLYTASIFGSNQIKEYSFLNPWSVTSIIFEKEIDVSSEFSYCSGIEFSPDGSKMYITGGQGGSYKLISYQLSTPWDIYTAAKWHELSTTTPGGVRLKPDGTMLYFLEAENPDVVKQYSLSSPWNLTTRSGSPIGVYNITTVSGENRMLGISFLSDGTKMFATGEDNSSIFEFTFGTPWDITTLNYALSFYVGDKITNPVDVFIRPDKEKFIAGGGTGDKMYEYNVVSLAKGFSTVLNGSVNSIQITQPGAGYTEAPTVTLSSPYPAVNATAVANVSAGIVTSISITNAGFGYTIAPSLTIGPAPISRQATAIASISNTGISSIRILDGGLNYVNAITVTFDPEPQDILNVEEGEIYTQVQKIWKWSGTEWQEQVTDEFKYLDPTTNTLIKVPGNAMSKPITNYEYEVQLNEKKRQIVILKPQYLSTLIQDLRNMMKYDPDIKDYISDNLKSTYNEKLTGV